MPTPTPKSPGRFRLLKGTHVSRTRTYETGDIVESPHDLTKVYKNKFAKVKDGDIAEMARENGAVPPVAAEGSTKEPGTAPAAASEGEVELDATPEPEVVPPGKDVTDRFPKAKEQEFKVYRSEGLFFVYDADDLTKPINAKGLNKSDVDKTIETAIA